MFSLPYEIAIQGALVFIRISGILFALPLFGDQTTPLKVRILLSVALAILIHPLIDPRWFGGMPASLIEFFLMLLKEILVGLTVGFVARIAFDALVAAAKIVSFQMGFGTANLFMPSADYALDAFSGFHRALMILMFLSLNLHQIYFNAIVQTFAVIPCGGVELNSSLGNLMIEVTANLFVVAIKLAAPVLVALLFAMAGLGLIARTVPQMNVFTMSFPISFFLGLLIYIASIPFFPSWLSEHFAINSSDIMNSISRLQQ